MFFDSEIPNPSPFLWIVHDSSSFVADYSGLCVASTESGPTLSWNIPLHKGCSA
jgi:hypothetical protein